VSLTANDVNVNGTLGVVNDTNLNGALDVAGLVALNGVSLTANDVHVNGALDVVGEAVLNGVTVNGTLGVVNDTNLNGALDVAGLVALNGVSLTANDVHVNGALDVAGLVALNGVSLTANDVNVNGTLGVVNDTNLNGALDVAGLVALNGVSLTANDVNVNGTLGVVNDTNLNGALDVAGLVALNGVSLTANDVHVNGALGVVGEAVLNGVTVNGTLGVVNDTNLNGALDVAGLVALNGVSLTANDVHVNGALDVAGLVALNGVSLTANDVHVNGALDVAGLVSLNGASLTVNDVNVNGNIAVTGTVDGVDIAATQNTQDSRLLTLENNLIFSNLNDWEEASSIVNSSEILNTSNDPITVDDATIVVNNLGTYRATFNGQYEITPGLCKCDVELNNLITELTNNNFPNDIIHAAAYVTETLMPGSYICPSATTHNGVLTLDAQFDPNAEFIFLSQGTHNTGASASISLINGAKSCNVFWIATAAYTFGATCSLFGTFICTAGAFTIGETFRLDGRLLTAAGAITCALVEATAPIEESLTYLVGSILTKYLFYTTAGAITTSGYTKINPELDWNIKTSLGSVTGFGAPYDGNFDTSILHVMSATIGIYMNDVLADTSIYIIYNKYPEPFNHINLSTTLVVDTEAKKTITIKAKITTFVGGLIFNNRSLFVMPLFT